MPSVETAVCLLHDAAPRYDEKVAIVGQGLIGLLVTALLSLSTFVRLTVIDPCPSRLQVISRRLRACKLHSCLLNSTHLYALNPSTTYTNFVIIIARWSSQAARLLAGRLGGQRALAMLKTVDPTDQVWQ